MGVKIANNAHELILLCLPRVSDESPAPIRGRPEAGV